MSGLNVRIDEKRFDDVSVVRDLAFSAQNGEFLALVGPSGAGKSTLLNMISGLDTDFVGSVCWDDQPLYAAGQSPAHLGMMFQEPRLMPWLSTLDNVSLVLSDPHAERQRAIALLQEVGLGDVLEAWPSQLSGGMQRRVSLARAFVVAPRLLLMDEPFVSLDMPTGNRLRDLLLALWQRDRPLVLFVTHDLREALALADRVLFLSPSPSRVMLDYTVPLERPRRLEGTDIARLQEELFRQHPDLLSGVLATQEAVAGGVKE
ncbi:ABC transporter ATP-binding protein [Modicisalibacter luteus]|uniref:ABC transporter ATP-binding protein n=1 Tax=Modicisalibacter luteus TaxID=453962 RepID=A0ABV7LZH0_9GAMM|nr:ABC transporter ATP-binding protein [Halomonas lutea]GHB01509.1 nitrate/sulfonate/bicarbonate ABC transporter ATP-binding protein [Halomonas lutea]